MLEDKEELYESFSGRYDKRLNAIKRNSKDEKLQKLCSSEIKLHWAVINWRRGNYLQSAIQIKSAYSNLIALNEEHPEFIETYKSLGILHVLLSAVPQEYSWAIRLLGFDNNLKRGLSELEKASGNTNVFQTEAKILLSYVKAYIFDDFDAAMKTAKNLRNEQDSELRLINQLVILSKCRANDIALEEIKTSKIESKSEHFIKLLSYLKGEAYLKKGEYENSQKALGQFLQLHQGRYLKKSAEVKLAFAKFLNSESGSFKDFLKESAESGDRFLISDIYADYLSEKKEDLDRDLLKCRLLFDGGYYNQADEIAMSIAPNQFRFQYHEFEYFYRLGRIQQSLNKNQAAEKNLLICIEKQGNEKYYYAPNACLQLAKINLAKGDKSKAENYLEDALKYTSYPYKRSIEHKVKVLLNEIEE